MAEPAADPPSSEPPPPAVEALRGRFAELREQATVWVRWVGSARLLGALGTALVVAGAGWWLLRAPSPPTEARLPMADRAGASTSAPVTGITASSTTIAPVLVVHVAGAVRAPGVYELQPGDRVLDAIAASGGPTADADVDALNLAAPVDDGDRVFVPRPGEVVPVDAAGEDAGVAVGPVDVNTAGPGELESLPGIGPAIAAAIVEDRDRNGPFVTVEDLERVAGVGPAKLDAIRDLVTT